MISVEARGRLGNHMFQFAFGLATSKRLRTDFAMNDELLRPSFRLGPWASPHLRANRAVRFRTRNRVAPLPVVKVDNEQDPRSVLPTLADGVHYAGFFQSLEYFADSAMEVRAAFEPLAPHSRAFRSRYGQLAESPYVCCHVRRTDYTEGGYDLPLSYYHDCLELVDAGAGTSIVFVGDDLSEVERAFGGPNVRFEQNDEIVDLQLLMHASVVVTSNSSFAWWGSWLGRRPGRPIYAPKDWLGFKTGEELPRAIIPRGWRRVEAAPA